MGVSDKKTPEERLYVPFLLTNTGVDSNGWEVALAQQLVEFSCSESALDEDDDLVEWNKVKNLVELSVLLLLIQLDV